MSNAENLYSMIIKPSDDVSDKIRSSLRKVSPEFTLDDPHITLGRPFYCTDKGLQKHLSSWLEMQQAFCFTLDKVRNFPGLFYLTSKNKNEINKIEDLYYRTKSMVQTDSTDKRNNVLFVPHLTLVRSVPETQTEKIRSRLNGVFNQPINMMIDKVEVSQRVSSTRWESLGFFAIGPESEQRDLGHRDKQVAREYTFGSKRRASVQPVQ